MRNKGKNFIIAFLMILAIYQTAELWFEDFSSHNFFAFLDKTSDASSPSEIGYTLENIIINTGDNKMLCLGSGIYGSSLKKAADEAIAKLLTKGQIISEGTADWSKILRGRCLIYRYSSGLSLGKNEAEGFFGVSNGSTAKIKSFDTVALSVSGETARLRLINSETLWCMELMTEDSSLASSVNSLFSGLSSQKNGIYYISSVQNGFEIFKGNAFIPRWDGSSAEYIGITSLMQYEDLTDKTDLEAQVNLFFDNPAGKWSSNVNGVLNYSDESTVVKYYPNGVLEYSNYDPGEQSGDNSFYTNYMACQSVLEKDLGISNEFYLRGSSFDGDRYTLYFGYKLNNFPIVMSDRVKEAAGMEDYIELYADHGRVSKYKRYCAAYSLKDGVPLKAEVDFLSAVDGVYTALEEKDSGSEQPKVDSLSLSYIDRGEKDSPLSLWWTINIEGAEYTVSTSMGSGN